MTEYKYAGFMSYAHADEAVVARVHHALETFKIPRDLSLNVDKKLHPIFRDTTELTAHHSLSEKIKDAVNNSKFLIVLCSPTAKSSQWVNEEIRLFRSLHGEASILCVLIEGTPETSFPPSLIEGGREPLAANLGTSRESFRLGVTQLAASMLGVGLDTLIQRDARRRRRRMQGVTAAAAIFSTLMATTAFTAVTARNSAEISRTEAEKMVEFMLTDLKQDLEPVGKLDILDGVGKRVSDYYNAIPLPDMDDERLSRQARARHLLAQVAIDQGKMDEAKDEIDAAYQATEEVLRRNPENTDAIFAHAQSAYWAGEIAGKSKSYEDTLLHWQEYEQLGSELYKIDPNNVDWIMEAAFGQNNLASHRFAQKDYNEALKNFKLTVKLFKIASKASPSNRNIYFEIANGLSGASRSADAVGEKPAAQSYRLEQIHIYENLLADEPENYHVRFRKAQAMAYFFTRFEANEDKRSAGLRQVEKELQILTSRDPENSKWQFAYDDVRQLIQTSE